VTVPTYQTSPAHKQKLKAGHGNTPFDLRKGRRRVFGLSNMRTKDKITPGLCLSTVRISFVDADIQTKAQDIVVSQKTNQQSSIKS
jgi:hypothetical protein